MKKIRVLIVDDSAVVRSIIMEKLAAYPQLDMVGSAPDPYIARRKILSLKPHVLLLDIEMPRMDGLTFLHYLMKSRPMPVIIMSSLIKNQQDLLLKALDLGAVDILPKPGGPTSVTEVIETLVQKIQTVAKVDFHKLKEPPPEPPKTRTLAQFRTTHKIIAIGTSTGGTQALSSLCKSLPAALPPILTVIHMPPNFTASFAQRLDKESALKIKEAKHNEILQPGTMYIAPGGFHMVLKKEGITHKIGINKGPKVHNCRPAVDVLFDSVAKNMGRNARGVLLTGMGSDGAQGLKNIQEAGGFTIAQDEESSIVFGMPKAAIDLGAARLILPLSEIRNAIIQSLEE